MTPIHPSKVAPLIREATNTVELITPVIQFCNTLGYTDIAEALLIKLAALRVKGQHLQEQSQGQHLQEQS